MAKQFSETTVLRNQNFIAQIQRHLNVPADGLAGMSLYALMSKVLGVELKYPTDEQLKNT